MNSAPTRKPGEAANTARHTRIDGIVFDGHWSWLHTPDDGSQIQGSVLLCAPLGREARNAHRSLWLFAQHLSADGFAVLRYDHRDTGESLPLPDDADHWTAWLEGVENAAHALRQRAAASGLVLAGLRIGASLAALAAEKLEPDAAMLLEPVLKGRTWLREMQIETGLRAGQFVETDRGLDADGLWLGNKTIKSLMPFDLTRLAWIPPNVFLASRSKEDALLGRLRALGADVCTAGFAGYQDLFKDAYRNEHPRALFAEAQSWLKQISRDWEPKTTKSRAEPATLDLPDGTERAVTFGCGQRGMLTVPFAPRPKREAVIFINGGGDPRAGIGGFATAACRELCRRGIGSLRFDLRGFGDSDFAPDWRSHVYETPRDAEFDAAIALLLAEGFKHLTIAGLGSAGYHAIDVAGRDARISCVYSINAAVLAWRRGDPLDPPPSADGRNQPWPRDAGPSPYGRWQRALRGDISVRSVLLNSFKRFERRMFLRLNPGQTHALRQKMRHIAARGGSIRLVMGAADCSLDELEAHFGRDGRWLAKLPHISVRIVDGLDHGLLSRGSRRAALKDFLTYMDFGTAASSRAHQVVRPAGMESSART